MISIVVPVYNAELLLPKCIESIRGQNFLDWELILINDGSQDRSLTICNEFALKDTKIIVVDQVNAGPSTARNKGIALAQGTFITFIDADDFVDQYYLEKLLEPFMINPAIQLSCGGYFELSQYHKNGLALHDFQGITDKIIISKQEFFENIFDGVTGVLWGKMFLANSIKKHAIVLDVHVKLSEDLLFVFEYATHITNIALVKEPLYYYNRLNENGLSGQLNKSNLKDLQLTNHSLAELGSNNLIPNLKGILQKRYTDGIVNITRDIANGNDSVKQKIKDLKYILSENKGIILTTINLNKENKIHITLFVKKQFVILIVYNTAINFLRNLKNKQ